MDTSRVSGLELRAHAKEEVELFLLAREDGMGMDDAAAFSGVSTGTAHKWVEGALLRSYTGAPWGSGRIDGGSARTRWGAAVGNEVGGLYDRIEMGPLAGMTPDMIEKLLIRAVLDDLKGEGSHPLDPDGEQERARQEIEEGHRSTDDDYPFP